MIWSDIQGWFDYDDLFSEIVEKLPDNSEIVEIGCWLGKSTAYMCKEIKESGKNIKYNCVDIWDDNIGIDFHKHSTVYQKYIEELDDSLFNEFKKNMKDCGFIDMINIIKSDSSIAADNFKDNSLDFCFVDGDHSYEGSKKDIEYWYPKMKKGSYFCGHDYCNIGERQVARAVDEFAEKHNLKTKKHGSCWYIVV